MNAGFTRRGALALIGAAALASPAKAQSSVAAARVQRLARGFNLPDQAPLNPDKRPDRLTLRWLRERGMTHVRLPFDGEAAMSRFSGKTTIDAALGDLDRALDLVLGLDFAATVDMHPGAGFAALARADAGAAIDSLRQAWRVLAERIGKRPPNRVFAEPLNEPPLADATWRAAAESLVAELRGALPDTTFIVGPAPFQRVEALAAWRPFVDVNVAYAFHYYDPMVFTHQGLTWDASDPIARLADVPFPSELDDPRMRRVIDALRARGDRPLVDEVERAYAAPWTKATIERQFAPLAAWSKAHAAAVVLNEFGVLRFKAPRSSRLEWLRDVREVAEASGFGWAHWDYREGFGLLNESGQPDAALIDALLPPEKHASFVGSDP
ncbi:MAG TPA: cellulase family glycosylhydrolase [Roseiarcus sp.]|nr:cellulase family glycosylhydrolase [Roseiarcus sp.]